MSENSIFLAAIDIGDPAERLAFHPDGSSLMPAPQVSRLS